MAGSEGDTTTPGPRTDEEIPDYLRALGIPALADIHVHFLPQNMLDKVWGYFDGAQERYGMPWPTGRFSGSTGSAPTPRR